MIKKQFCGKICRKMQGYFLLGKQTACPLGNIPNPRAQAACPSANINNVLEFLCRMWAPLIQPASTDRYIQAVNKLANSTPTVFYELYIPTEEKMEVAAPLGESLAL